MKTIILHGSLADQFGERFEMDVRSPAEAVRALSTQLKGFADVLKKGSWHLFRGEVKKGNDLKCEELTMGVGKQREIHIMPSIQGAGNGVFQTIIGVALVVVGVWTQNYALAASGAGLAFGGISQMLTGVAATAEYQESNADERSSFLFDGPVNTSTQGLPVPLIYGKVLTGSAVVSAGMKAERIWDDE